MQRSERKAGGPRRIGGIGQRLGFLGIDLGEGMQLAVRLGDTCQQAVDDLARGELLGREARGQLGQGQVMELHQ
jgi:hypothetical protein